MLVERSENKVTSFKLTKYDFAAAYLDTSVLLLLLTGMHTWVTAADENGYTLRLASEVPVYLVDEKGYDLYAYEWPWTKTEIPPR
jgi:hypothetical protein